MEFEHVPEKPGLIFADEIIGSISRRLAAAHVTGQQRKVTGAGIGGLHVTGLQGQTGFHLQEIEGIGTRLLISGGRAGGIQAIKHIGREIQAVRPDAAFGIIGQPGMKGIIGANGIAPVGAGWIGSL